MRAGGRPPRCSSGAFNGWSTGDTTAPESPFCLSVKSLTEGMGKVAEVNALVHIGRLRGEVEVSHARWATHGGVTEANAHPHLSNSGQIALVHNGIVTNYIELREDLRSKGFSFNSQTDTEVIVNLLQLNFEEHRDVKTAMMGTVARLKGNYSFAAVFSDGTLAAARFHEPLMSGYAGTAISWPATS